METEWMEAETVTVRGNAAEWRNVPRSLAAIPSSCLPVSHDYAAPD
jgi:hypothetical protein